MHAGCVLLQSLSQNFQSHDDHNVDRSSISPRSTMEAFRSEMERRSCFVPPPPVCVSPTLRAQFGSVYILTLV